MLASMRGLRGCGLRWWGSDGSKACTQRSPYRMGEHMNGRQKHGFVVRMFFRDCAFLMRFFNRTDDNWVWQGATYSTSILLITFSHCLLLGLSLIFGEFIPKSIHPLTCSRGVLFAELFGITVAVGIYVDFVTKDFKYNVNQARQYMTNSDRIKWALVTFSALASIGGVVALLALFGDRYR